MCFFLEKDILGDTLEQEKGELKSKNRGRKSIVFCMKAFTLRRSKKNRKYVTDQDEWILFVRSRDSVSTVASWKGHPCGELYLSFIFGHIPFPLPLLTFILDHRISMRRRWQCHIVRCAQSQRLLLCRHCQEAFLLAFFKATPDWYPSFTALCFLPHIFLKLSQSCSFWIFAFEGSLGWTASFWLSGNTKLWHVCYFCEQEPFKRDNAADSSWRNYAPMTGFFLKPRLLLMPICDP